MNGSVVTRFAPSPTGFLHIGGARTALFNWLYAHNQKGKMLLRIEDTDQKRSTQQAVDAILEGLKWLGLDWDGEPVFQRTRQERHKEIAKLLLKKGKAYYCYCSPEEIAILREEAQKNNQSFIFRSPWRDSDPTTYNNQKPAAIRLKTPLEGQTVIRDQILGEIYIPNKDLEDVILLRADGTPTYMLSVVVDDHDMNVTSIIRGDDHLTNAAKQILIYQAMNWQIPEMAHIPLIHAEDGSKLSKRHGALGVEAYRAMGYLPDALCNYLAKLGWSYGDQEIMNRQEMCKYFSLSSVNKSPSRFDFKKLNFLNQYYIRTRDDKVLLKEAIKFLDYFNKGRVLKEKLNYLTEQRLLCAMPFLKERSKTLIEFWENAAFLLKEVPLLVAPEKISFTEQDRNIIEAFAKIFASQENWVKEELMTQLKNYATEANLKFPQIAQPLRLALSGYKHSLPIGDMLYSLGQEESCLRLQKAIHARKDA